MPDTKQIQVEVFSLDNNEFESTDLKFLKQFDSSPSETTDSSKIMSNSPKADLPTQVKPKIQEFHNDLDRIFADFDKEVSQVLKESPDLSTSNNPTKQNISKTEAHFVISSNEPLEQSVLMEESFEEDLTSEESFEQSPLLEESFEEDLTSEESLEQSPLLEESFEENLTSEEAHPHLSSQSIFFQTQDPSPLINNKRTPQRISVRSVDSQEIPVEIHPLDIDNNTPVLENQEELENEFLDNVVDFNDIALEDINTPILSTTTENTNEVSSFLAPEDIISEYVEDDSFDPLSTDILEDEIIPPAIEDKANNQINFSDIITNNNTTEEEDSNDEVTIDDIVISEDPIDDEEELSLGEITIDDIVISEDPIDDEEELSLGEITIDDIVISEDPIEEEEELSLGEITIDDIVISEDPIDDEEELSLGEITIDDIVISEDPIDDEEELSLGEITIDDIVISEDPIEEEEELSLEEIVVDEMIISEDSINNEDEEDSLDEVSIDDIVIDAPVEEDASSISIDLLQQLNQSMPVSSSYLTNLSKDDIIEMMKEIDNLLEFLPDEKIEELSRKDFYHTYIRFLDDLGI